MDTRTAQKISTQVVSFLLTITFLFFASITKANTAATASLYRTDTSTQGSWQGVYGGDGYSIATSAQSIPAYASFAVQNQSSWTWAPASSDPRALQTSTGRIAPTWYSGTNFTFAVNFTDGGTHVFSLYALDWDNQGRAETIQIVDANTNNVLASQTVSNFTNGIYLAFNVSGSVKVNVVANSGPNAVISGVFFGSGAGSSPAAQKAASASFVRADIATQGNWQGAYGSDGYSIANSAPSIPSYAVLSVQNQSSWTWAAATSDARALQTSTGRIAATWYSAPSFTFDVNFTDGNTHTVAIYALDWDYRGRSETIQIVDANSNAVLSSQNISNFSNGMYLVFNISGHVKVNLTVTSGPNAVVSGVFFGTVTAPVAPVAPVTPVTPSTFVLTSSASTLSFGTVTVSSSAIQTVTLTNAGTGNIAISNVLVSGAGFNASGVSNGTVLLPGQSATVTASFTPASAGNLTGSVVVSSNAGAEAISFSGTGAAQQHSVTLSWTPSSSTNITGYNTYYSTVSGGPYAKLNASPASADNYVDSSVTAGMTRYYVVTSVNSGSQESGYSTEVGVTIP